MLGWNGYARRAMMVVRSKLEQCQSQLQGWSRHKYGNVEKAVKKKKKDKTVSTIATRRWGRE
jgi:hypothetical protein